MRQPLILLALMLWGCQQSDPKGTDLTLHKLQITLQERDQTHFGVNLDSIPQPPFGSVDFRLAPTQRVQANGHSQGAIPWSKEYKIEWSDEARRQQGQITVASVKGKNELRLTWEQDRLKLNWSPHSLPDQLVSYQLTESPEPQEGPAYGAAETQRPDTGQALFPSGTPRGQTLQGYFERVSLHRGQAGLQNSLIKVSWQQNVELPIPKKVRAPGA